MQALSNLPTVAVVGMGYVGAVSAAALAQRGCRVIGVETHAVKLDLLRQGRSPVSEPCVSEALGHAAEAGIFTATDDLCEAAHAADVIMIAVGTPTGRDGQVDLAAVDRVTEELADALRTKPAAADGVIVMLRSTVPPGTTRRHVAAVLEEANARAVVCHHPEFLREGSAMRDWRQPPMIVYGVDDPHRLAVGVMIERLYGTIDAPRLALRTIESELMKYACNAFHAVKIDFANEIGSLAAACGADPDAVMRAFCQDRKLNLSAAYLRPGFAFGGSCLPKDTRALSSLAQRHGLELPLIDSVLESNAQHLARNVQRVMRHGRPRTLLVGLSFKTGTDDLRESPMVELAERLLGKGVPLIIYDPDLAPDQLLGANARYIEEHLPHLRALLCSDLDAALEGCECVVIAKSIDAMKGRSFGGKIVEDLTSGQGLRDSMQHDDRNRAAA